MTRKVLAQTAMNVSQLHSEMQRIKSRDAELGFRAQKTVDYLEQLEVLDEKKASELYGKLEKLEVPRLRDIHFHKLIDALPKNGNDVKVVLQSYNVTVSQESCKKIADVIAEYA